MTDVDAEMASGLDNVDDGSSRYDLARGLAVGAVVLCWCLVCVAARKIQQRQRKLKEALDQADTAVVV